MATLIDMTRVVMDPSNQCVGAIYSNEVSASDNSESSIYKLPVQAINAISARISGTGKLQFSIDDPVTLAAGTGTFSDWTEGSAINNAVTAFKVVSTAQGTFTARVTVRTLSY